MAPARGREASRGTGTFAERVWATVRRIPRGRVASYKLVGVVAGHPRSARFVGRVMAATKGTDVPWHRVVSQDGRVVIGNPALAAEQARRLRSEGVPVDAAGRLDYAAFEWRPRR